METQDEAELIFAAEVHPSLAMYLLHLSQELRPTTSGSSTCDLQTDTNENEKPNNHMESDKK